LLFALNPLRIYRDAFNWAHLLALWHIEMTDTFRTFIGVDLINLLAHVNRVVGAFWLTHIAINAFIGDDEGHSLGL
jgi:hypothetical protein